MNLKNIFFNALLSWGEEASGVGGVVVLGRAVRIADLGRQLPQTLEFPRGFALPLVFEM